MIVNYFLLLITQPKKINFQAICY